MSYKLSTPPRQKLISSANTENPDSFARKTNEHLSTVRTNCCLDKVYPPWCLLTTTHVHVSVALVGRRRRGRRRRRRRRGEAESQSCVPGVLSPGLHMFNAAVSPCLRSINRRSRFCSAWLFPFLVFTAREPLPCTLRHTKASSIRGAARGEWPNRQMNNLSRAAGGTRGEAGYSPPEHRYDTCSLCLLHPRSLPSQGALLSTARRLSSHVVLHETLKEKSINGKKYLSTYILTV